MPQIYKGNDHNVRKQIGEEIDAAIAGTTALEARVAAVEAAPVVTGSATGAFSAELVLTAGSGITLTPGAGTLTVASFVVETLDEIPAPVASIDFAQQQAVSFVIENRTSDPSSPADGQIWLRTDL